MSTSLTSTIKVTAVVGVVGLVGVLLAGDRVFGATFATGNGTGGLELTIDSASFYNNERQPALSWDAQHLIPGVDRFFDFTDVKPGDFGTSSISVHVRKNPAWVCLDFKHLRDEENGTNEPESQVDTVPGGDLSRALEFFAWRDDGDHRFEVGEVPLFSRADDSAIAVLNGTSYALADSKHGRAYQPGSMHYVGITWCAGALTVNLETASVTCNGDVLGNEIQTDRMQVDVVLRAVAQKGGEQFSCTKPVEPPCELHDKSNKGTTQTDCDDDKAEGHYDKDDLNHQESNWHPVKPLPWQRAVAWIKEKGRPHRS